MKFLCTLICAILLMMEGNAKLLRVGFSGVPAVTGVDYSTFYTAYQAAENGDSIYVFPGSALGGNGWGLGGYQTYWEIRIAKRLNILSKGNWLDSSSYPKGNDGLQATKGTAAFNGRVFFQAGSEGSVLSGFSAGDYIYIQTNNITIRRNFNFRVYLDNYDIENLLIESNYRVLIEGNDNAANKYKNIIIRNNFIYQFLLPAKNYSGVIENNTWAFDRTGAANGGEAALSYFTDGYNEKPRSEIRLQGGNWLFQNNLIVFNPTDLLSYFIIKGGENSTFNYNVRLQSSNEIAWPGTGVGNINVPAGSVANIFEAFPAIANSSADGRYRLIANSPAKAGSTLRGAGATVDAGMFGGPNPYKLSTIPSIPTIYSIGSPTGNTATGNSIQINISTRSNN